MEWSGPAIRLGLDNRHLIREGHGRSRKVKEGHGWSFPITGLTFQVRKVMCGWGGGGGGGVGGVMACRIIVSAPVPVPFLWISDL